MRNRVSQCVLLYVQNKNEDIVFINLSLNNMIDQLLLSLINTAD